jgi:type IV secretory pathway component VirB8
LEGLEATEEIVRLTGFTEEVDIMGKEESVKYSSIVTEVFDSDTYFSDALDWYCLKYLNAFSERTFFIVMSVMSLIVMLMLYTTIQNILPLRESFPVLVKQRDSIKYFTTIKAVKPDKLDYNSNEAMLRMLLIRFVRELFTHNYKTGRIEDLNLKLLRIKNYSTDEVLHKFRGDLNKVTSQMFNKNIEQKVLVKTFKFVEKSKGKGFGLNFFKKFISTGKSHSEAEIDYDIITILPSEKKMASQKILLDFKFDSIKYNSLKKEFSKPVLVVTNYNVVSK